MPWLRSHRRFRDRLSAYIDGRLDDRAREDLDRHLDACPDCRRDLSELRATVQALHDLPQSDVPHSFALTPAHLERPARPAPPRPAPQTGRMAGLMTGLRLSAAALTVALVAVVFVDLGGVADDETADRAARSGGSEQPSESQFGAEPYATGTAGAEDSGQVPPAAGGDPGQSVPTPTPIPDADTPTTRDTDDAKPPDNGSALAVPTTPPGAEPASASEAAPAEDGGFDALLAAEIVLAVALAVVVAAAVGFTLAGRKG